MSRIFFFMVYTEYVWNQSEQANSNTDNNYVTG